MVDNVGQQAELDVLDALEPLVVLVERVDKVLDLGHRELLTIGEAVKSVRCIFFLLLGARRGKRAHADAVIWLDLGVPAVGGVVGHLVRHVLAEAEARRVDADLGQESRS
jgi:hypothetical protein